MSAAVKKDPGQAPKKAKKKGKKERLPQKRTMNLYYKEERSTKPATITLYILFVLALLLGASKFLVYDLWMEKEDARRTLEAAQDEQNMILLQLTDYNEVSERYQRYAATEEEQAAIDRLEILELLESAVMPVADIQSASISNQSVQLSISGVTLAQIARIVQALEASPIVAGTTVNTAASNEGEGEDSHLVQASIVVALQKEGTE